MHKRTYKYRIYPTRKQQQAMNTMLDECRWLYNHLLEERQALWEEHGESTSLYHQIDSFRALKEERPSLKDVHSQVLQNVAVRLDLAFKAFFRRVKNGEDPGYPRFRGKFRYDSFTYPQWGNGCKIENGRLYLSKIGHVKIILHRPFTGTPKTGTVRRTPTGKWFVTISCEVEAQPLPSQDVEATVGIDVGLESFATLSTGEKIENPRFFRQEEKELAKAQRRFAKTEKGTPERQKRRKVVARVHERITNKRHDFIHQHSHRIVERFAVIAVEDLHTNRMVHNHCLAKSIHDAAWSEFFSALTYKAAYAGRQFVAVNPAYTSQDCHRCGHRQAKTLSERTHRCPCCGLVLDRDHNAALNIWRLGLQSLRTHSVEAAGFLIPAE